MTVLVPTSLQLGNQTEEPMASETELIGGVDTHTGVERAGACGAGLARHVHRAGIMFIDVPLPGRPLRARGPQAP
jgi:hypothetical protein